VSDRKDRKPTPLAFPWEAEVQPQGPGARGDALTARQLPARPRCGATRMEAVGERRNLLAALPQVSAHTGRPGGDGLTVEERPDLLQTSWPASKAPLLQGGYQPPGVNRGELPQPGSQEKWKRDLP
jgi:hypothetical protein